MARLIKDPGGTADRRDEDPAPAIWRRRRTDSIWSCWRPAPRANGCNQRLAAPPLIPAPASAASDRSASTDPLGLAAAAYLTRFTGSSREHTESAHRPHLELCIWWMQEIRRFKPSTVSRRFSVVAGFYRTCVIGDLLEHSPAEHVRRPSVPPESPTLGFKHLQFEALLTAARESLNTSTSRSSLLRAGQTLLSLSAHGARQERKPEESHTKTLTGSRRIRGPARHVD